MKSTQVVSGFLLGASLLIPSQTANAQIVLSDGDIHIINDASYRDMYFDIRNGTTLRLEAGGEIGGDYELTGAISVHDTSVVELAGGRIGGAGDSSGAVNLFESSRFVMESGALGGAGVSAGQVMAVDDSEVVVLGGVLGDAGDWSGAIGLFNTSHGEIHGGQFVDGGMYSGTVIAYGEGVLELFLCDSELPFGSLANTMVTVVGRWKDGTAAAANIMRAPDTEVALLEDCDDVVVDTDGDGVADDVDACPDSDLRPTVWIFNIDTRIPNLIEGQLVNADGCSLADLVNAIIEDASANARNRGEFLRAVARGLQALGNEGLLPTQLHGYFQNCAARCNWDEARKRGFQRHGLLRVRRVHH